MISFERSNPGKCQLDVGTDGSSWAVHHGIMDVVALTVFVEEAHVVGWEAPHHSKVRQIVKCRIAVRVSSPKGFDASAGSEHGCPGAHAPTSRPCSASSSTRHQQRQHAAEQTNFSQAEETRGRGQPPQVDLCDGLG
jgi:hypothetical protein